jgi:solute carrier family 29 (equilibrative nucleoside transporter), member 1/2/3
MDRIKRVLRQEPSEDYEPIRSDAIDDMGTSFHEDAPKAEFSWVEYIIFLLLGVSMLWAWYVDL